MMAGLTNSWSLVTHLALDLLSADFAVRLFAATQGQRNKHKEIQIMGGFVSVLTNDLRVLFPLVRTVLSIPEASSVYPTFERKILAAMNESKSAPAASADSLDRRESLLMTLLACLAQMGISIADRERTILLHMCLLWRDRPSARPTISLIYQQLSTCLHYHHRPTLSPSSVGLTLHFRSRASSLFPPPSTTSLMDDHFDFIMHEWLTQGHTIEEFPREILMQGGLDPNAHVSLSSSCTLESFLKQYQSRIAAIVVIHHDTMGDTLNLLLTTLGCDLATLLKKHFAICCARFYAIYSQGVGHDDAERTAGFLEAATSCLNFFKTAMQERK